MSENRIDNETVAKARALGEAARAAGTREREVGPEIDPPTPTSGAKKQNQNDGSSNFRSLPHEQARSNEGRGGR